MERTTERVERPGVEHVHPPRQTPPPRSQGLGLPPSAMRTKKASTCRVMRPAGWYHLPPPPNPTNGGRPFALPSVSHVRSDKVRSASTVQPSSGAYCNSNDRTKPPIVDQVRNVYTQHVLCFELSLSICLKSVETRLCFVKSCFDIDSFRVAFVTSRNGVKRTFDVRVS